MGPANIAACHQQLTRLGGAIMVTVASATTRAFYLALLRRKATWNVNGKHASAGLIQTSINIKWSSTSMGASARHAVEARHPAVASRSISSWREGPAKHQETSRTRRAAPLTCKIAGNLIGSRGWQPNVAVPRACSASAATQPSHRYCQDLRGMTAYNVPPMPRASWQQQRNLRGA